jgi:hypothetical protein
MGRPIRVTIDSDDLKEMFYERVNYAEHWMKHYEDAEAFCEYYDEQIDSGVYDGWKDFNIAMVVDNDVVNEIDTYTEDEYVKEFGTIDEMADRILFQASNGIILISARG